MKKPEILQAELSAELTKMTDVADQVTASLSEMAALAQEVPAQVKEITDRAASWAMDVRIHGERVQVKDPAGGVIDLHRDMIFFGCGGGDITAGKMYINLSHGLPGMANFRAATELEVRAVKERFGQGRIEDAMQYAARIGT